MQYQDEVRSVLPATLSLCCCKKKSFFFFFVRQRAADLQRQSKSSRLSNANACMPSAFWSLVATRDATQQSLELATPLPSCHCQTQCICICVCLQNLGYSVAYRGIPLAPPLPTAIVPSIPPPKARPSIHKFYTRRDRNVLLTRNLGVEDKDI